MTHFDPDSIMLYMCPGSLFQNRKGTKANYQLSDVDKAFIAGQYPR